jgi:hypothetical protein
MFSRCKPPKLSTVSDVVGSEAWRQFFVDLANLPPPPPPLVGDGLAKTLVQTSYSIWHGGDGLVDLFDSDFIPFLLDGPF